MSTLYIHLPSQKTADLATRWEELNFPHALITDAGLIEFESVSSLLDLSETITKSKRVTLILAASDVTILCVKTPPLSPTKLKLALPHLVEEHLLSESADCLIIASDPINGSRTIAIAQRIWIEQIWQTILAMGAKNISIFAAQLCLPPEENRAIAVLKQVNGYYDLTVRGSVQSGIGLAIQSTLLDESFQSILALFPASKLKIYVSHTHFPIIQTIINNGELQSRISVDIDHWKLWMTSARQNTLDFSSALKKDSEIKFNWSVWRWPVSLMLAILILNITALNVDYWLLKNEANNLRKSQLQIYQAHYPKDSVIIDPVAQMQQKITLAKRDSGVAAPNDFTMLVKAFSDSWFRNTPLTKPGIARIDYREQNLFINLKLSPNTNSEILLQQIKPELKTHHLTINTLSVDNSTVTWQLHEEK